LTRKLDPDLRDTCTNVIPPILGPKTLGKLVEVVRRQFGRPHFIQVVHSAAILRVWDAVFGRRSRKLRFVAHNTSCSTESRNR
jgi:hypothetical protein